MKRNSIHYVSHIVNEPHLRSIVILLLISLMLLNAYISSAPLLAQSNADFTLIVSPNYLEETAGGTVTYPVFCNSINNFAGTVSLSLTGDTTGVIKSYSFSINPVALTANATVESDLTITTNSKAQPGYYSFAVIGTSSSLNHSYQINLSLLPRVSALSYAALIPLIGTIIIAAQICFRRRFTTNQRTRALRDL